MATLIAKIVESSGTGHWATLNLAFAADFGASGQDLVAQDENVINILESIDGVSLLSTYVIVDGFTTDATRKLTFEVPFESRHGAVYPIVGNVAHATNIGDAAILPRDNYISFSDLAIVSKPGTAAWIAPVSTDGDGLIFDRCLIVNDKLGVGSPATETYGLHYTVTAGETNTIRNCIIMNLTDLPNTQRHYGVYQSSTTGGSIVFENCLIYSVNRGFFVRVANGATLKNCIVLVSAADFNINDPSRLAAASTNNAYVGAAGANDIDLTGITLSDIFVDPDNYDWRLKEGSPLRSAGANLISDGVTVDINGNARPTSGPFDIGPHQFQAAELSNPIYVLQRPVVAGGKTKVNDVDTVVVEAPNSSIATELANSVAVGDSTWNDADVTEVVPPGDYAGAQFRIRVGGQDVLTYTVTAGQTMADVGNALAAALAATSGYSQAAWSGATLTVAGSDNLKGDQILDVLIKFSGTVRESVNLSGGIVGVIVDQGSQGDALTVQLLDVGLPRILGVA